MAEERTGARSDGAVSVSVVIPVFRSEPIVGRTVADTLAELRHAGRTFEIVLVEDASPDGSWEVVRGLALEHPEVRAIRLLRNSGQHVALLCGLGRARGDVVVTMDDDLQNPPSEIERLLAPLEADASVDLVLGAYERKRHHWFRRLGSRLVRRLSRSIFVTAGSVTPSNFRAIRRPLVDRVLAHRGPAPFLPGVLTMYAHHPVNVTVVHAPRAEGTSTYGVRRIARVLAAMLLSHSPLPLRLVSGLGVVVALGAFLLSAFYTVRALTVGVAVPGWTTVVVLVAFLQGVTLLLVGLLGEYLARLMFQMPNPPYHVIDEVGG